MDPGCAIGAAINIKGGGVIMSHEFLFVHLLPPWSLLHWPYSRMEGDNGAAKLRGMVWMCSDDSLANMLFNGGSSL
jgi:hypothetical protein